MAISIDFGTSNTVIARWNSATGKAETINLPGLSTSSSPPLIPSLVYWQNPAVLGRSVLDQGLDLKDDPRYFSGFKRGIGTEFQGFLPEIDGQQLSFELVGEAFLAGILADVNDRVASLQENRDALVVTVPVDSFDTYRRWLSRTCENLAFDQISLLDESTAAALGYGLSSGTVLTIDFGGGTIDFSLVQLSAGTTKPVGFLLKFGGKALTKSTQKPQVAKVLAKAGQNLGGTDIDGWIAEYIAAKQGLRVTPLIMRLAEKLKIQLSLQTTATEAFFDDKYFETYEFNLTRAEFLKILQQQKLFDRLDELLETVNQQALRQNLDIQNVDAVLIVGGTSQIPAIQEWIASRLDKTKIQQFKPFEAIAHGALEILQGLEVTDFLYHSYGIRYWDRRQNCHSWHRVINAGQPYPMSKPVELLLGASQENQPSIELLLGELGSDSSGTEVYFDGDRLITRNLAAGSNAIALLNAGAENIAPLTPVGFPGSDRIRVEFAVDVDRCLRLTVYDLLTGEYLLFDRVVAELS
jgi:molecular chaperone DnaK (HSP70)